MSGCECECDCDAKRRMGAHCVVSKYFATMQFWLKVNGIDALSTGRFPHPFARSLAPLAQSLALELMRKRSMSTNRMHQFRFISTRQCAVLSYFSF